MQSREHENVLLNLLQIAAAAILSFIVFFFVVPNHSWAGGAAIVCGLGEIMAAKAFWDRRHRPWFWLTLAAVSIVQGGMIVLIPWSKGRFPGMILLPIGLADYAAVYAVLKLVKSLESRSAESIPN